MLTSGSLPMSLGGDRFDDGGGIALHRNGAFDAAADAGHHDGIELGGVGLLVLFCGGFGRLGLYAGRGQRDGGRQRRAKQVALELHVPLSKDVVCDEPGASRDAIARLCHAGAGAPERAAMVVVHAAAQTALHTYSCIFRIIM